ncbi:hypothetical protein ACFE04_022271 [Oxalis oulophora]
MSSSSQKSVAAVLYHCPCPDGAFAALAAHLYFKATCNNNNNNVIFFPNAVYNPITPPQLPLNQISHLYLLDYVGPPGFAQDISSMVERVVILELDHHKTAYRDPARRVVILDHHKTAIETLGGGEVSIGHNVAKILDIKRSGATIAFDYFKDKLKRSSNGDACVIEKFDRVRPLFEYIEDGDLWKWTLPNSKAFSSGLKDLKLEFDVRLNPSLFDQLLSLDLESVINQGMTSLAIKQKLIQDALDQSYEIALGGGVFGPCLAVNVDAAMSELRSELGHQLATKSHNLNLRGVGAIVYKVPEIENDQILKISLRSIESEDTTPISQEFGGGGHRNASSFMLNSSEFDQWKLHGIKELLHPAFENPREKNLFHLMDACS